MTAPPAERYTLVDRLYLWLLTRPLQPVLVGELTRQGVSLRYAESWLRDGFALSEELPLIDEEFLPDEKGAAAGVVDSGLSERRALLNLCRLRE